MIFLDIFCKLIIINKKIFFFSPFIKIHNKYSAVTKGSKISKLKYEKIMSTYNKIYIWKKTKVIFIINFCMKSSKLFKGNKTRINL